MAASNIGNINVNLTATIGNFAQGLQDAANAAEKQSAKIKSEFNSLGTAIQAAARQAEASKTKFQMGNVFGGIAAAAKEAQKQADIINKELNTIDTKQLDSSFEKLHKAHAKRMAEIKAMPSALDKVKNKMHEVWGRGSRVFISGINKIKAASTSLLNTFGNLTRSVIRYGKWLVLAAAYGLKRLVQSSIQSITTLKNLGGMLGIATDKLQGLQYAAQQADIPAEKMNKALEKMTRRTSEAAHGLGEAQGSLKELGLDAKELNKLTPDEAFLRIAGAMSKVQNQADKTRLATKIFDDEQTVLLNLIDKGEPAIRGYVEQFNKMGIALSSVDTAKVTQAGTAIANIKTVLGGLVDRLTVALAPAITDISERLIAWASDGDKAQQAINNGIQWVIQGIGKLIDIFNGLKIVWLTIKSLFMEGLANIHDSFMMLKNGAQAAFIYINMAGVKVIQFLVQKFREGFNKIIEGFNVIGDKVGLELDLIQKTSIEETLGGAIDKMQAKLDTLEFGKGISDTGRMLRANAKSLRKERSELLKLEPGAERIQQWWDSANQKANETAKAQEKITSELSDQMDLEKSSADASFKISKGGRFALNQTPGAGGDSGDKMIGSKLDEQTGILKQLVRKDTAPVLG